MSSEEDKQVYINIIKKQFSPYFPPYFLKTFFPRCSWPSVSPPIFVCVAFPLVNYRMIFPPLFIVSVVFIHCQFRRPFHAILYILHMTFTVHVCCMYQFMIPVLWYHTILIVTIHMIFIWIDWSIKPTYLQSGQIILDFSFDSVQFLEFFFKMFNGK